MRITKNPDIRRKEIIDSARLLFQRKGIKNTSMNDIADSIGVAKGLVYYYFSSKEDLLRAVLDEFFEGVDEALQKIMNASLNFYQKLASILDLYFNFIQSNHAILSYFPGDPIMFSLIRNRLSDLALFHSKDLLTEGTELGVLNIRYPDYMLKIIIRGLGDLYVEGVTDPLIHARLIEQMLGLEDGIIDFAAST
jgi:AcrR family transcriptional regulator